MIPYKHYGSDIIEDVVDEVVGCDDLGTEDYPCESTMTSGAEIIGSFDKILYFDFFCI